MTGRIVSKASLAVFFAWSAAATLFAAPLPRVAPAPWPFWQRYAEHFIRAEGRVSDPDRNGMTTSEGQSYAMFFAIVANDPTKFEQLRAWTEANLSRGDLANNLPAWSWGANASGNWGVLDPNSASDSDLWIAYDLLEAGALWNKVGYKRQGLMLLKQIAQKEVAALPQLGPVLLPGHEGFHPSPDSWILNPSYMPMPLFNAAAHVDPDGPWKQMAASLPQLLERSSVNGYAMDWVLYTEGQGFAPTSGPGENSLPPQGSYDAIRVYLWLGIGSPESPARTRLLATFSPISRYLRAHPLPPEKIAPDGTMSGTGPIGFSAALTPLLESMHEKFPADEQQHRMVAAIDPQTGLIGSPARYYDQNLAMFASGWIEKRFRFSADGTLRVVWKN